MATSDRGALWESGHDETVEVNQRALIDKVLARYSGEFTVFRELLQNADDAGAVSVEIRFETKSFLDKSLVSPSPEGLSLPDLKHELVHQWTFRNDGTPFREEDWSRLKKIAEGNPDEQKIGAFGVGFYSLFSVTEEPFVKSGSQWMGFYWKDKKDQLFARRGTLPYTDEKQSELSLGSGNPWTSFEMGLREPAPLPGRPVDIARFLATSLTFMTKLRHVSLYFNDYKLAGLVKAVGVPKSLGIPKTLKPTKSGGVMEVKDIKSTELKIEATVLRWVYQAGTERIQAVAKALPKPSQPTGFFQSLFSSFASPTPSRTPEPPPTPSQRDEDLLIPSNSFVELTVYSADVSVKLEAKMAAELERATKKKPPSRCDYQLIYTGKDEYDASKREDEKHFQSTGSVFQGLRADLDGAGTAHVFIGHSTAQTTGIGGHVAARFIPTVERESIDLVDRNVSQWNKELLHVGGFLARAIYEFELADIQAQWSDEPKTNQRLQNKCLHALQFFTFHSSTPSSVVSRDMETAFFESGADIPLVSTVGVCSSQRIRLFNDAFSGFLKTLPMLPLDVVSEAPTMVLALRNRGMIRDVSFVDVLEELRSRPLSESEMIECLKWRIVLNTEAARAHDRELREQFLSAAVFTSAQEGVDKVISLVNIRTYVNPRSNIIPVDCPLPDTTLPFSVSKNLKVERFDSLFEWRELNLVDWVSFLVSPAILASISPDFNLTTSPNFSERLLTVISRSWPSLPKDQQIQLAGLLGDKPWIPTTMGMRKPIDAYLPTVNLFPDLPIVTLPRQTPVRGTLEKVLLGLGMRKHVDLQLIFSRMITTGDWSVIDLLKYLVTVKDTLSPIEWDKLQKTAAFPKETSATGIASITASVPSRFLASDLYEPSEVLRELELPILDWSQAKWRTSSEEAKFLYRLGLRRFPPIADLIALCTSPNRVLRETALRYLLDNFTSRYAVEYDPTKYANISFIPAVKPGGATFLAKPSEVFTDPESAVLGFPIVVESLREDRENKLKLAARPPTARLVTILLGDPPKDSMIARRYFEYLANRISDFSQVEFSRMRDFAFIPAASSSSSAEIKMRMVKPSECYFEQQSTTAFHSQLFTFVDFGIKANNFLRACGVKNEPTIQEIAQLLVQDPRRFYQLTDGPEGYLNLLRNIATNHTLVKAGTSAEMKKVAFLLGIRRIPRKNMLGKSQNNEDDLEDDDLELTYDLLRPDEIVVVDDSNSFSLFESSLWSAPQEDILEGFYLKLGSRRLSTFIREDYKALGEMKSPELASDTHHLILERLPLFLHEQRNHSRCVVKPDWLAKEGNFKVLVFGKLQLTRTLDIGGKKVSKTQEASAAAKRDGQKGPILLLLGGNDKLDLYEVAHSLCRIILQQHRINDSLLFMTILSTDLRALRRRGYNVDRILNQQKLEKQMREARQKELARQVEPDIKAMPGGDPFHKTPEALSSQQSRLPIPPSFIDTPSDSNSVASDTTAEKTLVDRPSSPSPGDRLSSKNSKNAGNVLSSWRQKFQRSPVPIPPVVDPRLLQSLSSSVQQNGFGQPGLPDPFGRMRPDPPDTQSQVTPTKDIERNIDMAIAACREEKGSVLRNREQMTHIKESLDEGYCDVSGREGDFQLIAHLNNYRFYVAQDLREIPDIGKQKHELLMRFTTQIVEPLRRLYNIPAASIAVFFDGSGPLIGFNRNASIFLNLRFYEAWHDKSVQSGDVAKALVSWYFVLAHEIAHNLVSVHNSEHEFYMSSICEKFLLDFTRLLSRP